jgi:glycosyltransferase involved in cell wall biosynthesis
MSVTKPALSIIMPVYNTEKYIKETIESLLNQTFTDFELIVVDDACTDDSINIIKSFRDDRIKIITNNSNKGIVKSRNTGLALAVGEYIAPFDSDDIALPEKFEKQILFMQKNPQYGLIGCWGKSIDEEGKHHNLKWRLTDHAERIPAILLFRSYFLQPTVVMRREAMPVNGYVEGFEIGEDYMMWFEIAKKFKMFNYPEYLYLYRIHKNSITQSKLALYQECEFELYKHIYAHLEIDIDTKYFSLLQLIKNDTKISGIETLSDIEKFLMLVLNQNLTCKKYDQKQLNRVVFNRWMKVCFKARKKAIMAFVKFITSPLISSFLKS